MNKLPVGVLETIEDTIDRWNQFSGAIADEKLADWPSCLRLKDDISVVETYITQLEASLAEAKADSKRLHDLELALKEGDVCDVTASDMIEPGKWEYIEIQFDSDREPVIRGNLADAIDEALEEQNRD
jgi:hypothetical protein